VSAAFSSYQNLVYAPHVYTHAFTVDQFIGYRAQSSPYPPSYDFGYQTAEAEAQSMHAAIVVTEYGASSSTNSYLLAGEEGAQEDTLVSGSSSGRGRVCLSDRELLVRAVATLLLCNHR
jgi:hypothetical protein